METVGLKKTVRHRAPLLGSMVCLIVLSGSIKAQTGDPAKARMQEMDRRELQLSRGGSEAKHPSDPRRSQAMIQQVGEDFNRILTLHNEIVRSIVANRPIDLRFISGATGEIRKRSARLQSSLMLPKPEEKTDGPETVTDLKAIEMKDGLILLCKRIENFIRNPIIETPGTVDAEQLKKARSDLQSVVELSDAIKKLADRERP